MVTELKSLSKSGADPKPLTDIIDNNCEKFRSEVTNASTYRRNENCDLRFRILKLQSDIDNMPYHIFGNHTNCASYFCKGQQKNEVDLMPELEQSGLLSEIENIL